MNFLKFVRLLFVLPLGLSACVCFGQTKFYTTSRPEAWVIVKRDPMGVELVTVTYQGAKYPLTAIESMLTRLGKALGNEPRNFSAKADDEQVVAKFVVHGLINDSNPKVNLAALAVAMAFGDRPIKSFGVFFDGLSADKSTPRKWFAPKNAWMMEGVSVAKPKGLDYRVQVNTAYPNEIYMPDSKTPTHDSGKPEPSTKANFFILGGIFLGAIAVGLLVYSALLKPRKKGR